MMTDEKPSRTDPGIPRRVLSWISDNGGVHNDCLLATDPCVACRSTVMRALETVYADAKSEEDVLAAIINDFRDDHIADGRRE